MHSPSLVLLAFCGGALAVPLPPSQGTALSPLEALVQNAPESPEPASVRDELLSLQLTSPDEGAVFPSSLSATSLTAGSPSRQNPPSNTFDLPIDPRIFQVASSLPDLLFPYPLKPVAHALENSVPIVGAPAGSVVSYLPLSGPNTPLDTIKSLINYVNSFLPIPNGYPAILEILFRNVLPQHIGGAADPVGNVLIDTTAEPVSSASSALYNSLLKPLVVGPAKACK